MRSSDPSTNHNRPNLYIDWPIIISKWPVGCNMCVICSRCKATYTCPPATKIGFSNMRIDAYECPYNFNYVASCKDCWAKEGLIGWSIGFIINAMIMIGTIIGFIMTCTRIILEDTWTLWSQPTVKSLFDFGLIGFQPGLTHIRSGFDEISM